MKKNYLYVCAAALLFATMEVVLKVAGAEMDSFQLTFLRFMIAGVMFLPLAISKTRKKGIRLGWKDVGYFLLLGILCVPFSMMCFQMGIMRLNASTAAILFCVNPIFTVLFAHFGGSEKLNRQKWGVLFLGIGGLIMMIRPWDLQTGNTTLGALLMVLAAAFFGLYTVLGKYGIEKFGIIAHTTGSFILGSLVLLVVMLGMGTPVVAGVMEHPFLVAYISIFVTGGGYCFYFAALQNAGAQTAAVTFFIKPCIAPVIAVIVLGDHLLWNTYAGIGLILLGSFLDIRNQGNLPTVEDEKDFGGQGDEIG